MERILSKNSNHTCLMLNIVERLWNISVAWILDNRAENRKERWRSLHGRVANFVSDVPRTEIRVRCKIDLSPDLLPRTNKAGIERGPRHPRNARDRCLSRGIYTTGSNPYFTRATLIAAAVMDSRENARCRPPVLD